MSDLGISVVIPARNIATVLPEQLEALVRQQGPPGRWEVIVVDNGSTDDTVAVATQYQSRLPLRLVSTGKKGVNAARNAGIVAASHEWIALCDGDDVVDPTWLATFHHQAAKSGPAIIAGSLRPLLPPSGRTYGRKTPDAAMGLPRPLDFLPFAPGGNQCIHRRVWSDVGGFDEDCDVPGSDDIDFSWRAQISGYEVRLAPEASVAYRYRDSPTSYLRQTFWYGVGYARLYRDFRGLGARRRTLLGAMRSWAWVFSTAPLSLVRGGDHLSGWLRVLVRNVGYLYGGLRYRVVYF